MIDTPHGYDGVCAVFGDPAPFIHDDGSVSPLWESSILTTMELPAPLALGWKLPNGNTQQVRRIRCHMLLKEELEDIFDLIFQEDWSLLRTFDGCYAWRLIRGHSPRPSIHSWGAAVDLNAATNKLGTVGDMSPRVVRAFRSRGWVWGGDFRGRKDFMHFRKPPGSSQTSEAEGKEAKGC